MDSTYYADTTMVGLLVHVEAPDRSISWTGVSGRSRKAVRHCSRRHRS
ncbi:MAG: hypothetical protein IPN30_03550 [Flavobacteriales bacterium]|nr:hypothetical protein [Flavobacteriales bacterium]